MQELMVRARVMPGRIEFNEEEVKEQLALRMELYKGDIVTPQNKAERKKDIAVLRKLKKHVEDRRKEIKQEWQVPYMEFERKVKECLALIDEPVLLLDGQVKELEDQERLRRKRWIEERFALMAGELTEWLTLDQIYEVRWENVSSSAKKVEEELTKKLGEIRAALATLQLSVSDVAAEAVERYKLDLNLTAALAYINQYEAQKARIHEAEETRRRKEEEERLERERQRIREEERARIREEEMIRQAARQEVVREIKQPISDEIVKNAKVTAVYTISAKPEQLEELEMALDSLGITWSRKKL